MLAVVQADPEHLSRSQHRRAKLCRHQRAGACSGSPAGPFGELVPLLEHLVRVGAELAVADGGHVHHPVAVDDHQAAIGASDTHASHLPGSALGA